MLLDCSVLKQTSSYHLKPQSFHRRLEAYMVLSGSYSSFLKDVYAVYFPRRQIAVQKLLLPMEPVHDASPSDDEYHLVVEELGKLVEPARAVCLLCLRRSVQPLGEKVPKIFRGSDRTTF